MYTYTQTDNQLLILPDPLPTCLLELALPRMHRRAASRKRHQKGHHGAGCSDIMKKASCIVASLINCQLLATDDGLPVGEFKSPALSLFHCSHVQKIKVCHEIMSGRLFIQKDCLLETKKDRVYKIQMQLEKVSFMTSKVISVALISAASILQYYAMLFSR